MTIYQVVRVKWAAEQRIIAPLSMLSMLCSGYDAQVPHGVIDRLIRVIGKIPTGVSAAGEIGVYGKIFLIWRWMPPILNG